MKLLSYARQCSPVVFCALFMLSEPLHAQQQGGTQPSQESSRRNYSLKEFHDFMSTFFNIPSRFTWEQDIKPKDTTTSPSRPVVDYQPPQIPAVQPAIDLVCLTLGADGSSSVTPSNLYNGACSTSSPTVPYNDDVGYTGTWCPANTYRVTVDTGAGQVQVLTNVPASVQDAPANINCSSLRGLNGQALVTPKPLTGVITYQCRAGIWKLRSVGCSDAAQQCPAGPQTFSFVIGTTTFQTTVNMPAANTGAAGPTINCTSFGNPGTGYEWAPGVLSTGCTGTVWTPGGTCTRVTARNVVYPNCVGSNTSYQNPYVKAGITACMNSAGTRYFWIQPEGQPLNACPDQVNGCE